MLNRNPWNLELKRFTEFSLLLARAAAAKVELTLPGSPMVTQPEVAQLH